MFPCCDCGYEKYLKQEPGNPVCQDSLDEININAFRTIDMVDATMLVGRCFVWEPANANAICMIVVVSVERNEDDEWFVECANIVTGERCWNALSRFDEATRLSDKQVSELLAGGKSA